MRKTSIKSHLKPYSISKRRSTTINHAFASAVAPLEPYDTERVDAALRFLGYDPDGPIHCFYCQAAEAKTWDHLVALVQNKESSGFGHTLGNLVPACQSCNAKKGNKSFETFLGSKSDRVSLLQKYQGQFSALPSSKLPQGVSERLTEIRNRILILMKEADSLLETHRSTVDL